jgi:hypothetical protein
MKPDPQFTQRYEELLADPANEDLEKIIRALETHYSAGELPSALSHSPRVPIPIPIAAHTHKMRAEKGPNTMENQTPLSPWEETPETKTRFTHTLRNKRSYPIVAIIIVMILAGGFLGYKTLHTNSRSNNLAAPPTTTSSTATSTTVPIHMQIGSAPIIHQDAASPITDVVLSGSDNQVTLQVHLDYLHVHTGDIIGAIWTGTGAPLYGTPVVSQGQGQTSQQQQVKLGQPEAAFIATLTQAGPGTVKVTYNGTQVYTVSFTIVAP